MNKELIVSKLKESTGKKIKWIIKDHSITLNKLGQDVINLIQTGIAPNYMLGEDGKLYYELNDQIYPVSHPDLSTQPSILSYRFGNRNLYEVMSRIADSGIMKDVPEKVNVIYAIAIGDDVCKPVTLLKINNIWKLSNEDYAYHISTHHFNYVICRYYFGNGGGYYSGGEYDTDYTENNNTNNTNDDRNEDIPLEEPLEPTDPLPNNPEILIEG